MKWENLEEQACNENKTISTQIEKEIMSAENPYAFHAKNILLVTISVVEFCSNLA